MQAPGGASLVPGDLLLPQGNQTCSSNDGGKAEQQSPGTHISPQSCWIRFIALRALAIRWTRGGCREDPAAHAGPGG